jgi:tRNA pseudouridine38-40 synthase
VPRYALKVSYIGTNYYGFQRQKKLRTIEGCLFQAFQNAELIEDPKIFRYGAAGRTDKGVHALGQVIAFSTSKKVMLRQLNVHLPQDIRVWAISQVSDEFNPRFDALSKHYKYFLPYEETINLEKMENAANKLQGIHNFKRLSKVNHNTNPMREIIQLKLISLMSLEKVSYMK